jgi:hypothetical protein
MSPAAVRHPLALLLAALAVAGALAAGAAPPHAHGDIPGLYNQEHDLTAFAALGAVALVAAGAGLLVALVVSAAFGLPAAAAPDRTALAAASRAPPRA